MTIRRFQHYSSREEAVFNRFLDYYANQPGWEAVREHLNNYVVHPDRTEDYDIRCTTEYGYITFDIQESENFQRYRDLRIDYISIFRPKSFYARSLEEFERALEYRKVTVEKWGKVITPKADFLVVEFHNGLTQWQVYNLVQLHQSLPDLRNIGAFKINKKDKEDWGSAFLAVPKNHEILKSTEPKTLAHLLKEAKPIQ